MRAAFWTASDDGSSCYRATQPAMSLGWLGHQATVDQDIKPALVGGRLDALVASRIANPGPSEIWHRLATHPARPKMIIDLDDDYFHIDPSNARAYEFWTKPGLLTQFRANMMIADVVTVCSQALAEVVERELAHPAHLPGAPEIRVIPNGLHAAYLGRPRDYSPEVLTIGWAGSAATAVDYDLAERAINKALDSHPDVRLRVVGLPEALLPRRLKVEAAAWVSPNEAYLEAVSSFDIWVAPYRDTVFNRAKFPTKALEAGTLGIPVVASDIRPYREWITPGVDGMLIARDHEWTRALQTLITQPDKRREIGEAGRSRAARNILQEVGKQWESALSR